MTAHHSVLVVETLGAFRKDVLGERLRATGRARIAWCMRSTIRSTWLRNDASAGTPVSELLEAYHDIESIHRRGQHAVRPRLPAARDKAPVERLYWTNCSNVAALPARRRHRAAAAREMPELEENLVDQYLCDFSVFQSMLDHWAIDQPFPIVPIDRLDERPTRRAMLVDLTCDSDGKVSSYVSANEDKSFLTCMRCEADEPYYLGIFLMGAYQDIMGDAHNLFGRVPEVHVYARCRGGRQLLDRDGTARHHDRRRCWRRCSTSRNDLHRRMSEIVQEKVTAGLIRPKLAWTSSDAVHRLLRASRRTTTRAPTRATGSRLMSKNCRSERTLRLGLVQMRCAEDPAENRADGARDDARSGIDKVRRLICLPELFSSRYFCQTRRRGAISRSLKPCPGRPPRRSPSLPRELDVAIVVSLFERRAPGLYHNTTAVVDGERGYLGKYRKMHIPDDPRYYEKYYFTPGDLGFQAFATRRAQRSAC